MMWHKKIKRKKVEREKKKSLKTYQSFVFYIPNTVRKVLIRQF